MVPAEGHDYGQTHSWCRIPFLGHRWDSFRERDHVRVDRFVLYSYKRLWIRCKPNSFYQINWLFCTFKLIH